MKISQVAAACLLPIAMTMAGCSMYGDSALRTHDYVADIAHSDKAIVFIDASTYGESILLGGTNKQMMAYFNTLTPVQTVEDGKPHVRDTFTSFEVEPLVITPGRYSFLGYALLNGNMSQAANIGGWTNTGRPLLAGFTVKAGEVIYLGHLNIGTFITPGQPPNTVRLTIEDHMVQDGDAIRKALTRNYPGAAERLQTRLLEVYMPLVPVKPADK